jgi:hypothetical protein
MDTCLDPRGSREPGRVVVDIIDGRPWIASRIRNNNLRQHCRMLGRCFDRPLPAILNMRDLCRRLFAVVAERSSILWEVHPSEIPVVAVLLRFVSYHEKWRRQPEDWVPPAACAVREHWISLLEHLFSGGVQLPARFARAWLIQGKLIHVERTWYCETAAGTELRMSVDFPASVSYLALYWAMKAPEDLNIRRALRWGQVKELGGSDALANKVLANRMAGDFKNDGIWLILLRQIVAGGSSAAEEFDMVADMLRYELETKGYEPAQELMALSLVELERQATGFWETLLEASRRDGVKFRAPGIQRAGVRQELLVFTRRAGESALRSRRPEKFEVSGSCREVHRLICHLELIAEGRSMKHWNSSYSPENWEIRSGVFWFQLLEQDNGRATISAFTMEIDCASRRVVHTRRRWLGWTSARQTRAVRKWARQHRMQKN